MGVLLPVITVAAGKRGAALLVFCPSLLQGPHRHSVCSTSMLPFPEGGAQRGARGRLTHSICWTSEFPVHSLKYAKRGLVNRRIASHPEVFIVVFSTAKVCAGALRSNIFNSWRSIFLLSSWLMLQGQNVLHSFNDFLIEVSFPHSTIFLHGLTPFVSWDCVLISNYF